MKKTLMIAACCLSFTVGAAFSARVRDWHDLDAVHRHLIESIHEMERARAANNYDMQGHGARAEELMRSAEHELHEAVEAMRHE